MKIAIGCDEAGCGLKHIIIDLLQKEGIEVTDEGCRDDEVVLYPNIAERVANIVADGEADRGILICGTGIGMAMAANKESGLLFVMIPFLRNAPVKAMTPRLCAWAPESLARSWRKCW